MKTSEQHQIEARRQHVEAIVARHVRELFKRLPMLSGFWLRSNLDAEVSFFTWPVGSAGRRQYEEVMQTLVDLAKENPEALQLMCGRTFARALH